jgi:MFS family permease
VLLSLFLAALDQTIVATALLAIVRDFKGINLVSWVSTGYLLANTAMVPIYGKLSDMYGRKLILLWGALSFCWALRSAASPAA